MCLTIQNSNDMFLLIFRFVHHNFHKVSSKFANVSEEFGARFFETAVELNMKSSKNSPEGGDQNDEETADDSGNQ